MNADTILSTLTAVLNTKKVSLGVTGGATLTQPQLNAITDALAADGLETVNPTTTYPPTGR